jgi:nucleoside phosphorylase
MSDTAADGAVEDFNEFAVKAAKISGMIVEKIITELGKY